MNQAVSPRFTVLRGMIMFPALTSFVLFAFCVTSSDEVGLNDPLAITLLGFSSIMGVFGLLGIRSLIRFAEVRLVYTGYLVARKVVLKNILVLVFMAGVLAWHASSATTVEMTAGLESINYNLNSLAVVLNLVLGTFWSLVLIESFLMYYFTYGKKYRRLWFDYFYQAGQLPEIN